MPGKKIPINEQVRVPDLDQPTWLTDIPGEMPVDLDPSGHMQFNQQEHGHPGLLTIHGIRDAMHGLTQELEEWEERGATHDEIPDFLRPALQAFQPSVMVRQDIAKAFHTDTFVLPVAAVGQTGGATLISQRTDRQRIVITNAGANPAFISFTDDVNGFNSAGETAWMSLPNGALPGNPREIRAGGKVYAYSPLGTQIDVQEEYGWRYSEEGVLNP